VFGISVTEIAMIAIVVLVIVGPHKLPGMLRRLGEWIHKLRIFTTEMRAQTGIDEILREEGIEGGLSELRSLLRGDLRTLATRPSQAASETNSPYATGEVDRDREYPTEGVDAGGALPDDLVDEQVVQELEAQEKGLLG
jgi:sec-independent protein translocase protein TatB